MCLPLAKRLPGLLRYVIGRAVSFGPSVANHYRAAFLTFDDAEAVRVAYRPEVGRELRADEKCLISDEEVACIDAREIFPEQP